MIIDEKGVRFSKEEKKKGCVDFLSENLRHSLFYAIEESCKHLLKD